MPRDIGPLTGIIVPTLTPLTADEQLDVPALERQLEFMIESGVDALFILGSNGEGAMLTSSTRLRVVKESIRIVRGRMPVIAGVLEISTSRIIEQAEALGGLGLAGYVVTTPLYFDGFSEDDLRSHFTRIADRVDAPVILYNIPQFAGTALSESLVRSLAEVPNIAGLKDSSGLWTPFQRLVLDPPEDFALLQGFHALSAVSILAGAHGLVPGYANLHPTLFVRMLQAARARDLDASFALQRQLDDLLSFRGPASIHANKVIGKALGLMEDHVSSPLPRLDATTAERLVVRSVAAGLPVGERTAILPPSDVVSLS